MPRLLRLFSLALFTAALLGGCASPSDSARSGSSVTVYGVMDLGVQRVTNVAP